MPWAFTTWGPSERRCHGESIGVGDLRLYPRVTENGFGDEGKIEKVQMVNLANVRDVLELRCL